MRLLFIMLLALPSCVGGDNSRQGLWLGESAPEQLSAQCRLAQSRCSRCHDVERIVQARFRAESTWRGVVERMRRRPASGIAPAETDPIVSCLVFRSNRGLR